MSVRVYLPTTRAGLAALVGGGELPPAELADSGPLRAEGDDEDSEYAALMTAADISAALVAQRAEPGGRRVVVVAEQAAPGTPVHLADVVAVHLDVDDRGVGADPDDDLAWFAPEELTHLT